MRSIIQLNEKRSENTFTVLQYNTLATSLSRSGFPNKPENVWEGREERNLQLIRSYFPDILCLQEVDEDSLLLTSPLLKKDYISLYEKKNGKKDGVCIAFKKEKFELLHKYTINYHEHNEKYDQVAIVALLQDRKSEKIFTIVTLHLKSKEGNEAIRNDQIDLLLQILVPKPILIVGDFNDVVGSEVYQRMKNAGYQSSYSSLEKDPSFFTTCKKREKLIHQTNDYIWYTDDFLPLSILNAPKLKKKHLPNIAYPSDHIPLLTQFEYL